MKKSILFIALILCFSGVAFGETIIDGVSQNPNAKITGGTIDGTVIGGTTPAAGTFTDVTATGSVSGGFATLPKATDTVNLLASECKGQLITNQGWDGADDQTINFPAAVAGLRGKFEAVVASGGTADTYFDTAGSTTDIYLNGDSVGDGQRVWIEEIAKGASFVFHTVSFDGGTTYDFVIDSINGDWKDKGS